jgi:ubiquinone biosynthesis accessory factor UbiJ
MNSVSTSARPITSAAICHGINHVLAGEPWASAELAKHAGKAIALEMPFGRFAVKITNSGLLEAVRHADRTSELSDGETASPIRTALILTISSQALSTLLTSSGPIRENAFKSVTIAGDADLAQLLGRLAGQLRWEYEEDLSKIIGDAPAHFAVAQGKKIASAGRAAGLDLLENAVEYLSEEKQVLLNQRDFAIHKNQLMELRDSVERLDKRIALLQQRSK